MIHAFVVLCLTAQPSVCQPPVEVATDHQITSPVECMIGGIIYFSEPRILQKTPESAEKEPAYFAKVTCKMEGDGSDIVKNWVEEEKDRAARTAPQIK